MFFLPDSGKVRIHLFQTKLRDSWGWVDFGQPLVIVLWSVGFPGSPQVTQGHKWFPHPCLIALVLQNAGEVRGRNQRLTWVLLLSGLLQLLYCLPDNTITFSVDNMYLERISMYWSQSFFFLKNGSERNIHVVSQTSPGLSSRLVFVCFFAGHSCHRTACEFFFLFLNLKDFWQWQFFFFY